jgi:hypothetical protein
VEFARRNRNNDYPSHRGSDRGDRGSDRGGGGGPKSRRASSHDKCLICGEYGHWAKNCSKGDGSDVTSGKCFKCGERGHIAKKCYKQRRHSSSSRSPSEEYRRRRGLKLNKGKWILLIFALSLTEAEETARYREAGAAAPREKKAAADLPVAARQNRPLALHQKEKAILTQDQNQEIEEEEDKLRVLIGPILNKIFLFPNLYRGILQELELFFVSIYQDLYCNRKKNEFVLVY